MHYIYHILLVALVFMLPTFAVFAQTNEGISIKTKSVNQVVNDALTGSKTSLTKNSVDNKNLEQATTSSTDDAGTIKKTVLRKVVEKSAPSYQPQRQVWPQEFTYINNTLPYYNLALPNAFGGNPLQDLPINGPMLIRGNTDTTLMTFDVTTNNPTLKQSYKDILDNRQLIASPAPQITVKRLPGNPQKNIPPEEITEITEFKVPPSYTYTMDVTQLNLPKQIQNVQLIEAGTATSTEGLPLYWLRLTCTVNRINTLLVLTLLDYNNHQYQGFYLFPSRQQADFLPLTEFSYRSLRIQHH